MLDHELVEVKSQLNERHRGIFFCIQDFDYSTKVLSNLHFVIICKDGNKDLKELTMYTRVCSLSTLQRANLSLQNDTFRQLLEGGY